MSCHQWTCVCVCVLHGMPSHTHTHTHTRRTLAWLLVFYFVWPPKSMLYFLLCALCVSHTQAERGWQEEEGGGRKSCLFKFNNEFNERRVRVQFEVLYCDIKAGALPPTHAHTHTKLSLCVTQHSFTGEEERERGGGSRAALHSF